MPACTLTSASRLASMTGARVVPFTTEVLPDYRGYRLRVFDPLEGFPSGSVEEDARRMNAFLETQIATMPEQYYWIHRRFRTGPQACRRCTESRLSGARRQASWMSATSRASWAA